MPAWDTLTAGEEIIHLGEALFENSPVLAQDLRVGGAPLLQGQKQESVPAVAILHTPHLHNSHLPPVTGSYGFCRCLCQPSLVLCAGSSGAGTQDGWQARGILHSRSEGHNKHRELVLHPSPAHVFPMRVQDDGLEQNQARVDAC